MGGCALPREVLSLRLELRSDEFDLLDGRLVPFTASPCRSHKVDYDTTNYTRVYR